MSLLNSILFSKMFPVIPLKAKTTLAFLSSMLIPCLAFSPLHAFSSLYFFHYRAFSSCSEAAPAKGSVVRCHVGNSSPMDPSPSSRTSLPHITHLKPLCPFNNLGEPNISFERTVNSAVQVRPGGNLPPIGFGIL